MRWLQIHIRIMNASPSTTVVEKTIQSLAQKPAEAQVRARVWAPVRILISIRTLVPAPVQVAVWIPIQIVPKTYLKQNRTSPKSAWTLVEPTSGRPYEIIRLR